MTGTHDNLKLVETMNYCKSDLVKGCYHGEGCRCKPLVMTDMIGTKHLRKWKMDLFDRDGKPVRIQCNFGKPNKHGARAVLEVLK